MNKLLSMLGLVRRAGKLTMGFDAAVKAIEEGNARGAIAAEDISEKTFSNLAFKCERFGVPLVRINVNTEELSIAIGKKAGVAAVCDKGLFEAICRLNINSKENSTIERKDG